MVVQKMLNQEGKESIYKLSLDIVDGKSYWIQEEGTSAIWFDKTNKNWKIGTKEPKRSSSAFYSNANVDQPQEATIWNCIGIGSMGTKHGLNIMRLRFMQVILQKRIRLIKIKLL